MKSFAFVFPGQGSQAVGMTASLPPVPPDTGLTDAPVAGARPGEVDFQLVQRTVAGDQKAFELLVIKYQRRIERLIGRMASRRSQTV